MSEESVKQYRKVVNEACEGLEAAAKVFAEKLGEVDGINDITDDEATELTAYTGLRLARMQKTMQAN